MYVHDIHDEKRHQCAFVRRVECDDQNTLPIHEQLFAQSSEPHPSPSPGKWQASCRRLLIVDEVHRVHRNSLSVHVARTIFVTHTVFTARLVR